MQYAVKLGDLYLTRGHNHQRQSANWSSLPNAQIWDNEAEAKSTSSLFPGSTVEPLYSKTEKDAVIAQEQGYSRDNQPNNVEVVSASYRGSVLNPMPVRVYINMHDHRFTVTSDKYGRQIYKSLNELVADWTMMANGK